MDFVWSAALRKVPLEPSRSVDDDVIDLKKLVLEEGKYSMVRRYDNILNNTKAMLPQRGPHSAKTVFLVYSTNMPSNTAVPPTSNEFISISIQFQ
jgi:hypothetical protein